MLIWLKAALGLFGLLGKLAPLAKIGAVFSWLPGGQIIGLVSGFFGLIIGFFKWLVVDITDAFKEPQRLLVRTVCVLAALGFGVYLGIKHDAHKVNQKQAIIDGIIADGQRLDLDNKAKLERALQAKKAAENAVWNQSQTLPPPTVIGAPPVARSAAPPAAAPIPLAAAKRVRKARKGGDKDKRAGVPWVQSVFGGLK